MLPACMVPNVPKKVQKVAGKRRGALDTNSVLIYYLNINLSRRLNCIIAVGA